MLDKVLKKFEKEGFVSLHHEFITDKTHVRMCLFLSFISVRNST